MWSSGGAGGTRSQVGTERVEGGMVVAGVCITSNGGTAEKGTPSRSNLDCKRRLGQKCMQQVAREDETTNGGHSEGANALKLRLLTRQEVSWSWSNPLVPELEACAR